MFTQKIPDRGNDLPKNTNGLAKKPKTMPMQQVRLVVSSRDIPEVNVFVIPKSHQRLNTKYRPIPYLAE